MEYTHHNGKIQNCIQKKQHFNLMSDFFHMWFSAKSRVVFRWNWENKMHLETTVFLCAILSSMCDIAPENFCKIFTHIGIWKTIHDY